MTNVQGLTGPGAGIILMLITLAGVAVIFVIQPFVKKVTNTYWFGMSVALFMLVYYISARFLPAWKNLHRYIFEHGGAWPDGNTYDGANLISRAFLLDFCPFFGLLIPILIIADPSRRLASGVAPIIVLGSLFTVVGGFPTCECVTLDPYWVFVGSEGGQLYIVLHVVNFGVGIGIILNSPKFGGKGYIGIASFVAFFIFYVLIVKSATKCNAFTSGLCEKDGLKGTEIVEGKEVTRIGTYYSFTAVFGGNHKLAMGIIGPLELAALLGAGTIFDLVIKNGKGFKYGNARTNVGGKGYDYNKYQVDKNIFGLQNPKIRQTKI